VCVSFRIKSPDSRFTSFLFYTYELLIEELGELPELLAELESDKKSKKQARDEAKKKFEEEAAREENGKSRGQPLRATIDGILKNFGIDDRGAAFGGDLAGPACRKLMVGCTEGIIPKIKEEIMKRERMCGSDEETSTTFDLSIQQWLELLDGFIAILLGTCRFELTPAILEKAKTFRDKIMQIERYLKRPITVKSHAAEDHFLEKFERLQGFEDLEESFGERNHETQSKLDERIRSIRKFSDKEK
jgi:hypothetical protein